MSECLSSSDIQALLSKAMTVEVRTMADAHLARCADCRRTVENQRLFQEVKEALDGDDVPLDKVSDSRAYHSETVTPAVDAIAGYEIVTELHRGGQGVVYKGIQTATKRPVALKVLLAGPFASPRQQLRFEREIDLVASLQHPNIVTIYDSGTSDGRQFYAMEFVDGQPLDQHVAKVQNTTGTDKRSSVRRRTIDKILRLFESICRAVGYAHAHGVIHRDLKPDNILVDGNGEPHVLDFGLAKLADPDPSVAHAQHTIHGEFLGTLAYASPEQAKGDPRLIDVRTDVYSLGVLLFEMLTGQYPYDVEGSITHVLENIRTAPSARPSRIRSGIDDDIETITLKALAKEPERRYQSAEQLARDVGLYLAGEAIDAKRDSSWYVLRKALSRYRVAVATVTGMVLNGGSLNRSGLASLTFQLSEATTVGAAGALILWNHRTDAALDVSGAALVNNGTNAVTWDLSGIALPDGNYTATLPKAAAALTATHAESFHILAGDSDGDGMVGFGDFGELASSFNVVGGPVYGPGDMDGNGDVGVSDFGILVTNFNRTLPAPTLDFGDAAESGTSFPTTLANNGARHVLGAGLFLGATVDAEANGQPDASAAGDGGDEDGVTFATLTAGTNAAIAVTATVPETAMLNAWIDVNADGDWDDTGEKIISDQAVTDGTNNLTAAIPAGAVPGQVLARFRITSDAGHTYSGLASDGEVEDHQVTLVAAKGSSRRLGPAASLTLWAAAFVAQPTRQTTASVGPQQAAESDGNVVGSMAADIVDLAIAKVASIEPTPPKTEGLAWLDEHLVDQTFNEEAGRLLPVRR